ncbi:hypothetical protein [Cohnella caldifontis]|uniref:hypothetical protein n=1 Tax=Cohnella caldifontis TaxID=3027471 RepID=UPI0023EB35EE|nr:hypothetical protein [Cohnella sp. YIM B05605]
MRAPIRKSLRKWMVGAGCTLSVALLLQHAKNSEAYQAYASSAVDSGATRQQEDPSAQDPVFREWQDQNGQDSGSGTDDGSSGTGGRFERHGRFGGESDGGTGDGSGGSFGGSGSLGGSDSSGSSGFGSRSGHS